VVFELIVIIGWGRMDNLKPKSPLQQKQQAYTNTLTALRADPTNPVLHEQALQLGRMYSAATREGNSVTLFDETALANDIRAVTANATQTTVPVAAPSSATAPVTSLDERINALLKMKASGLITDDEFDQKRKELLDSI
ncbi:MAG: SHOCT domain-containing protein, partial [Chloroflexales bacterium]|nr:SHOCT domain-containing protein [Chloroflexales bacterium]